MTSSSRRSGFPYNLTLSFLLGYLWHGFEKSDHPFLHYLLLDNYILLSRTSANDILIIPLKIFSGFDVYVSLRISCK